MAVTNRYIYIFWLCSVNTRAHTHMPHIFIEQTTMRSERESEWVRKRTGIPNQYIQRAPRKKHTLNNVILVNRIVIVSFVSFLCSFQCNFFSIVIQSAAYIDIVFFPYWMNPMMEKMVFYSLIIRWFLCYFIEIICIFLSILLDRFSYSNWNTRTHTYTDAGTKRPKKIDIWTW